EQDIFWENQKIKTWKWEDKKHKEYISLHVSPILNVYSFVSEIFKYIRIHIYNDNQILVIGLEAYIQITLFYSSL
ncbi:hypothetical protein, partial [Chitinophaga sp. GbtcB8]|uniref:hypothetical protein n=1 Tax=Chitinophaga sp. GbtcB8 TaxID=2824753 RepID=UPI001C304B9C